MRPAPPNLAERSLEARYAFEAAERAYERELTAIRELCQHKRVVECSAFTREPMRICTVCGAEEDGWGYGYAVLDDREGRTVVTGVTRDEFFAFRHHGSRHLVYPDWAKGAL